MLKKNKGFTLVEILAVIVIISILATAVIGAISLYVKKSKDAYNEDLEDQAVLVSKDYFVDDPSLLTNDYVTFKELAAKGYLSKDFIDAYGNSCMKNSYVKVKHKPGDLNPNNAKYHACIICDNDGYNNTKKNSNCDLKPKKEPPTPTENKYTVTVNVINGTVEDKQNETKEVKANNSFTSGTLKANEGFNSTPHITCNGNEGTISDSNKVKIENVTANTTCTVTYAKPGETTITLTIGGDANDNNKEHVSVSSATLTLKKGDTGEFKINVSKPSDRYKPDVASLTCDTGIEPTFTNNWKDEVNNKSREDEEADVLSVTLINATSNDMKCSIDYNKRWEGIPSGSYTKGTVLSYSGRKWTVVYSDEGDSTRLALNAVASGSANKKYSDAGTWLSSEWLATGTNKEILNNDKNNKGLMPLSAGIYVNSASGISTGLTNYNYYTGSGKFYNAAERKTKTLTKKALVTASYTKGEDNSMPKSVFNTGYTSTTISTGIKSLTDANKNKYYINSSGELVFPNADTPNTYDLPNSHYTDRYMAFYLYSSRNLSVGSCSSDSETLCTIRWNNYWKATITSSGSTAYESTPLGDGYLHFDGNSLLNDTEIFKYKLCGGSYHGKILKLSSRSSSGYTWVSPLGNSYNSSFGDDSRFRIAATDITNCPRTGKLSEYNNCTPTKVGVPHTRVYYLNESSNCKSTYKRYELTDLVKNIYYRPQIEVREW